MRNRNSRIVLLLSALTLCLASGAQAVVIQRPITINGNFLDWAPVLANPANYVADLSEEQGDPDLPGSSDRDLRAFAFTWDATNLYFYFRRTFSANNSVTFLVYIDLDHDGVLTGADRIVRYDFNGASASTRQLLVYDPAAASDPITGDGVDEPGDAGSVLTSTMNSAAHSTGIEVEASITWSSLGVADGTPLRFHASDAVGMNLPGQVRDNTDAIDTQYAVATLSADAFAAGSSPSTLRFSHVLTNNGNGSDRFDINTTSVQRWSASLWTDPDGDGDPSDGVLVAVDENGDGDYGDLLDTPPTLAWDSNANGLPDAGLVAPGHTSRWVVELSVPPGLSNGAEDTLKVLARSALDPGVIGLNIDLAVVGTSIISPDRERGVVPGSTADLPHRVCNFGAATDIVDLTWSSSLGWAVDVWSDPNGDGDPSDGTPVSDHDSDGQVDTDNIPAGTCVSVVARVAVPGAVALGTRNVATITAVSSNGYGTDTVIDGVTAIARVALDPDRSFVAIPGDVIYAPHDLVNGGTAPESYNLSASAALGSGVSFWSDPDCDGRVDDGQPITVAGPVAAFGGRQCVVAQIQVNPGLGSGSNESVTLTATSQPTPSALDTALDSILVVHLRTYANPLRTMPSDTFYRCGTVYAGAGGLAAGSVYRFVWSDPNLVDGPERTSPDFSADDTGKVDDRYTVGAADTVGTWSVKIQRKQGSSWLDVTPHGSFTFTVLDIGSGAGVVDHLATHRSNYALSGDTVRVTSEIYNPSAVTFYRDTTLDYVIFLDANGDGLPSTLETYIRPDGTSAWWFAGLTTHQRAGLLVYPFQRVFDSWQVSNVQFTATAMWTVHLTWRTSCNTVVADGSVDFSVGCFLKPSADAGADVAFCSGGSASIGSAAAARRSYSWSPSLGLSDAGIAQPVASPISTTTYTLTVTDVDTGCAASDTVRVTVRTPPAPDVTPDTPAVCVGDSILLDAGAGFAAYSWSTGDSSRTITVTPAATTTYTVTVTDAFGCEGVASETVTVNPLPAADILPDAPEICEGSFITLDAGSGYSAYLWSTGDTTVTITVAPTTTTTYSVTVTDGNGCESTVFETVTVDAALNPDVTPDAPALCPGAVVTLDAGAGYTSYLWSTGDSTRTIDVMPALTSSYTVTVTDAQGCNGIAAETVTVLQPPAPDILPDTPRICGGGSILLDAGPGFASYSWSTGESTRTISVTPAADTTYTVTVTDSSGCAGVGSETVLVDSTPVITPPSPETCAGSPVTLSAPSGYADYLWSTGETTASITVSPASSESYSVTVTDVNGCQGNAQSTVTVHALPAPAIVPDRIEICPGTQVVLDAGPGYAVYDWLSGQSSQTIAVTPAASGTYTVTVTDAEGCRASTSATVEVRSTPVYPVVNVASCVGATRVLDAGPGYASYQWSTGETTQSISVAPGSDATYTVTVSDSFGCPGTKAFNVQVGPPPVADAGPDLGSCAGIPVMLGSPAVSGLSYLWAPSTGLDDPTKAQPLLIVSVGATYTVQVTDIAGGCSSVDSVNVSVVPAGPPDPMNNLLRETKSADGADVHHWWTAKPGLQRYDISWAELKDWSSPQALVTLLGEGTGEMVEAGAVHAPEPLRLYRIIGSDCPFGLAPRESP